MSKLEKHFDEMKKHVGHRVQFYSGGHRNNFAKVLRVTLDADIEAVCFWCTVDGVDGPFASKVYSDQVIDCDCTNPTLKVD